MYYGFILKELNNPPGETVPCQFLLLLSKISHLEQRQVRFLLQENTNHIKISCQLTEISLTCNILLKYNFSVLQKVFANDENLLSSSHWTTV